MNNFVSSALGSPHQYRAWFSDQVWLVLKARGPLTDNGAKLACRPVSITDPYSDVWHTHAQVVQVLKDFDALNA